MEIITYGSTLGRGDSLILIMKPEALEDKWKAHAKRKHKGGNY